MASVEFQQRLDEAKQFRSRVVRRINDASRVDLGTTPRERLETLSRGKRYQEAEKTVRLDRWEQMGKKIPEYTQAQLDEAGDVFSHLNHGAKAAFFYDLASHTPKGGSLSHKDILNRFRELFSGTPLYAADLEDGEKDFYRTVRRYEENLCAGGFLSPVNTKNSRGDLKTTGFSVTEKGRTVGMDTALTILWYENHADESAYTVFGAGYSKTDVTAPQTRVAILDHMVRNPHEVRVFDLSSVLAVETDSTTSRNVSALDANGLVDRVSVTPQTGRTRITYQRIPGEEFPDDEVFRGERPVYREVRRILEETSGVFSEHDIVQRFSPEILERWKSQRGLNQLVSSILRQLSDQEVLTNLSGLHGGTKHSDITLTRKGLGFYFQVVDPVLREVTGSALSDHEKSRIEEARSHFQEYAAHSSQLYFPHSTAYKTQHFDEHKKRVLDLIQKRPGFSWVMDELSEETGLGRTAISKYLNPTGERTDLIEYTDSNGASRRIRREIIRGALHFTALPEDKEKI